MQSTMNSNQQVSVTKENRSIVSWLGNAAKKVIAVFAKKETPAINKVTEAISFIEWRTWYDHQRIIRYINIASFIKSSPELSQALGVVLPIQVVCDDSSKVQITDNSFERRLVRYFGNLSPETIKLLDGGRTKTQQFARKNARILDLYMDKIPQMLFPQRKALKRYEQQLLNESISRAIVVRIPANAQALLPEAVDSIEPEDVALEVAAEVVAEALPKIPAVKNTTPLTDIELAELRKVIAKKVSINKLTVKELKLYAKGHKIRIPGNMTKIRAMKETVAAAQNGSTKIVKI